LKVSAKQEDDLNPNPTKVPGLAPSNFHLIGPLEDAPPRCRFADVDELKHSMREELRRFSKELRRRAYGVSRNDGNSVLIVKNSLNFVKDVTMIFVKCITIGTYWF
jgi:hypothetical protein